MADNEEEIDRIVQDFDAIANSARGKSNAPAGKGK